MKTTTFGVAELYGSRVFVTVDSKTEELVTSFASGDGLLNVVHVRMSVTEARKYAHFLITYAERLDPERM